MKPKPKHVDPRLKVLFLKEDNSVFAYFTELNHGGDGRFKMCYSHVGGHSSCAVKYAEKCQLAKPSEYAALQKELTDIGYDLHILSRSF